MNNKYAYVGVAAVLVVAVVAIVFFGDGAQYSPKTSDKGKSIVSGSDLIGSALSVSNVDYNVVDVRPPYGNSDCYVNVDSLKDVVSKGDYLRLVDDKNNEVESVIFLHGVDDGGIYVCDYPCTEYSFHCCEVHLEENYY